MFHSSWKGGAEGQNRTDTGAALGSWDIVRDVVVVCCMYCLEYAGRILDYGTCSVMIYVPRTSTINDPHRDHLHHLLTLSEDSEGGKLKQV